MRSLYTLGLSVIMLTAALLNPNRSNALTFTAVANGNWSAAATWGGVAPPFSIVGDQVNIPSGITVTMNGNVTLNGLLANLTVDGTLTQSGGSSLTVNTGTVSGTGSIVVNNLTIGAGAVMSFSGSVTATTMTSTVTNLSVAADFLINQTLTLASGILSLSAGSSLDVGSNATIVVSGGSVSLAGGTVGLSGSYNVTYTSGSATAGVELTGTGLTNLTVDVGSGSSVTLTADVTIDGTLSLTSGTLSLSGNDLTLTTTADVSATGTGTISNLFGGSSITINVTGGTTGSLDFGTGVSVSSFTVNVGVGNDVNIEGSLAVSTNLNLTSGSLNFSGANLTISGNVSGTGSLIASASSNLTVTTPTGLPGGITFAAGGQTIGNFTVNVGGASIVTMNSNITVAGTLTLQSGILSLGSNDLTISASGDVSASGSGAVSANGADINISATGGLAGSLDFSGSNSLGSLTVNVGAGSSAQITGNVTVNGTLGLTSGSLNFSGANLTIAGNVTGTGSLSGSATANLTVTTAAGLAAGVTFAAGGQTVNNFAITVGAGNMVAVNSNLTITGNLTISANNSLDITGVDLTIAASGDIMGSGSIVVNSTTGLIINATGGLSSNVSLSGTIGDFTVNVGAGGTVTMASSVSIAGNLTLQSGSLVLAANDLTITATGDLSASGSGSISSTMTSADITINATGGLSGTLTFSGSGSVGNFTVNVGAGNQVQIGGNLAVNGALNLTSGNLNFSGANLTIAGNVTGTGSLSGNASANLTITTAAGLAGGITFATGGQAVNNLTVNVGAGNSVALNSDLTVEGNLTVTGANSLNISGDNLTIGVGGDFLGGGSFIVDAGSALVINASGNLTSDITLVGTIGDFTVNAGNSNTVNMGSHLTIAGTLTLQSGILVMAGNDLTINLSGDLSASGSGSLSTSVPGTDVTINASGGLSGALDFGANGSISNFTINVGAGSQVMIEGSLTVNGGLVLTTGTLNFAGANLTIDGNVTGAGSLSGSSNANLTVTTSGGLPGGIAFAVGGQMVNNFTINVGTVSSVALNSDLTIAGTLNLTDGSLDITGVDLTIGTTGDITGSGSLKVDANSSLAINATGGLTGDLSISGVMGNLTINIGSGGSVTLGGNLFMAGMLTLQNGNLELNGFDLTIDVTGDVSASGTGTISATVGGSDVMVSASGGLTGALDFSGSSSVGTFTINVGTGNEVQITGSLTVGTALEFVSGTLSFAGADLTIDGNVTGSVSLSGDGTANLTITTNGGLASGITFTTGGQVVNNFTINVGASNTVTLNTALAVMGNLNLAGGSALDITGVDLTIASTGNISGTGSLVVDANTNLDINASGGISADLDLTGGILGDLTINVGSGGSVTLGSDLTVNGTLTLTSGTLNLNGFDLTIEGDIAASGSGDISSTVNSDITISTSTSPSGALSFSASGAVVGDLNIDIGGSSGSISIDTDLEVDDSLNFTGGSVNIGGNTIEISTTGTITGAGNASYVITGAAGTLAMNLTAGGSAEFPVGTDINFAPAVIELNSGSASGMIEVGVGADVLAQGTTGADLSLTDSLVDATWFIGSDITANLDLDLEVMWSAAMEVNGFDNTQAYISHFISGSWDVSTSASAQIAANGLFSLRREGISSLSPFAVFQEKATGMSELPVIDLELYPNPATHSVTIATSQPQAKGTIVEVLDLGGRVLAAYTLNGTTLTIPVEQLSQGTYFIRLSDGHGASAVKSFARM